MPTSITRLVVVLTLMFVVTAGAFAALIGFMAIGVSISKVSVSAGPPTCTGTEVTHPGGAIVLRPGMECSTPVTVHNGGRLGVQLGDFVVPTMGTDGQAAVELTTFDGRATPNGDVDAVFAVDRRLEPGETWESEMSFVFRNDGCTALGTYFLNLPTLETRAWGRTARVLGPNVLFEGTRASSC